MWSGMMWPLTWNHIKDHNRSWKLCFHHPGHVPVIRDNPDFYFEDAGNGPVVITWISREHELYSGTSPISLVEHCVTFRHDRRLLSLLRFVHNWPTSRWSATKKENGFSLNGNGIMSRVTILSFHPVLEGQGIIFFLSSYQPFFLRSYFFKYFLAHSYDIKYFYCRSHCSNVQNKTTIIIKLTSSVAPASIQSLDKK